MGNSNSLNLGPFFGLKAVNLDAWKFYARFYRGSFRSLLLSIIISVSQPLILIPVVFLVRDAIDKVIPAGDLTLLVLVGLATFLLNLANGGLTLWTRHLSLKTTKQAILAFRYELLMKCYGLSRSFYGDADLGAIHTAIVQDTERLDVMSNALVSLVVPALVVSIGLGGVLIFLNWFLFVILICVGPLLYVVSRLIGKRIREWVNAYRRSFETFSKGILLVLKMMDLTRIQTAEQYEIARQRNHLEELRVTSGTMAWLQTAYVTIQGSLTTFFGLLILIVGGVAVAHGSMTLGGLLAFYVTLALLNGQLQTILSSIPQLILGNESLNTLCDFVQKEDRMDYSGQKYIPFNGEITFESVDFKYKDAPILHDVNMRIRPGTMVALYGPNGVGKTTIIQLILGFYRPQRGQIYADGIPFSEVDIAHLRRHIGVVTQDPVIFSATIWENITYGCPDAGREEVERATALATADEFVQALPLGYGTVVGESGMLLSAGQRQRIAIARAFLRRPRFLILDEPTTHLDEQAVGLLMTNLIKLDPAPAILIVSHDRQIVRHAGQVFMLEQGRIVSSEHPVMLSQKELTPIGIC